MSATDLWVDIGVQEGAEGWLLQVMAWPQGPVDVIEPGEEGVGDGWDQGDGPDQGYDPDGPFEAWHRVWIERMANGQVTLHWEWDNRQYGWVRCPGKNRHKKLESFLQEKIIQGYMLQSKPLKLLPSLNSNIVDKTETTVCPIEFDGKYKKLS